MHTPKKSTNINSAIGRIPSVAAPIAAPIKAVSEIGESMIRSGPNRSKIPSVDPKIPPYFPTSSPNTNTSSFFSISKAIASAIALFPVNNRCFFAVSIGRSSFIFFLLQKDLPVQLQAQDSHFPEQTYMPHPLSLLRTFHVLLMSSHPLTPRTTSSFSVD